MQQSFSPLIACRFGNLLFGAMPQEKEFQPENDATEADTGKLSDRVEDLRAKTSQLSQTFDEVEKNLREAAGE